jgi:hypothetical protein
VSPVKGWLLIFPGTGIAVLVRASGFHWTICTLFSVSFFMTDSLCLSSIAHFALPFYITSHVHNSTLTTTLMTQYVPLNQTTPYHNPCRHICLSLLGSLLCTQQLVAQNFIKELLSETCVNTECTFNSTVNFYLWTKDILR